MESNYSNRDFERYVQQNADQYRMFPSEKVWKGVHGALHTRRRWYGMGLAFLLLITGGAVTMVMRSYPVSKKQDTATVKTNLPFTNLPDQSANPAPSDMKDLLPFDEQPVGGNIQKQPLFSNPVQEQEPTTSELLVQQNVFGTEAFTEVVPVRNLSNLAAERRENISMATIPESGNSLSITSISPFSVQSTPADSKTEAVVSKTDSKQNNPLVYLPYTIESVVNLYKVPKKRVSWQIFFTPTISYRKLSENKTFAGSGLPGTSIYPFASVEDINNAVTHKPDLGLQLGLMARYPISKNLKLRAGLQFNINRYDIKAFSYPIEEAIINLDGGGNNTVSTWTRYRSQSGFKSNWLKNFYFSVSLPVGAELTLFGNKKTSVGVAGTIQPTYIISDRAYLISSDYKNYTKVPWLIRHVNMSTGFEAFVNYTKGKTRLQIGPQVRYQLLSSFQNKYPVKENLFDFGVRLGVTLNNR